MATLRGDQAVLEQSKIREKQDHLINWVGELARVINKMALYTESLEERISELENPSQNVKLS